MSKFKSLEERQIESDNIHKSEFILLEEPKNAHTKIKIKHINVVI